MVDRIFQMTPYLPSRQSPLQDMAVDIIEKSAALAGRLHPLTLQGLIDFLRITNTYYSNLIEDHNTHSLDIDDGLLISDTPKGPVRLHFSACLLPVWFPELGPG